VPLNNIESADQDLRTLVTRAKRGDNAAVEGLLRAFYPLVFRWAIVKLGSRDDAEDVCQEVMIRVHRYLSRFDERSRVTSWVYKITSNAVADHRRRSTRHSRANDLPEGSETEERVAPIVDEGSRIDSERAMELVSSFFGGLPAKQREVFDLADLQGYGPVEIAEMLDMNANTVRAHLFRARRFIRRKILETQPELVEGYRS
jgi:RNA polymerase sigma-70 factor (ECF subfamily)